MEWIELGQESFQRPAFVYAILEIVRVFQNRELPDQLISSNFPKKKCVSWSEVVNWVGVCSLAVTAF
jgi:hypothetical protein